MAKKAGSKVPAADRRIYDALAASFRAKNLYSFSYEGGVWSTWETLADWEATVRNGKVRDEVAAQRGHGPKDWDREHLMMVLGLSKPAPKLTKVQLVKGLDALRDKLPPEALKLLDAA